MGRVTAEDVERIITTSLDPMPFIDAANVIVTDRLDDQSLSEAALKEIERWLAAHFIAVSDPQKKSQSIDGASETYVLPPVTADGLKSTVYGQQALLLDSSGALANIGKRQFVFDAIPISTEADS